MSSGNRHVRTDIPLVSGYKRAKATRCYWPRVKAAQVARRGWFRVWLARIGYVLFCAACIGGLLWVVLLLAFTSTAGTGVFTH